MIEIKVHYSILTAGVALVAFQFFTPIRLLCFVMHAVT